MEQRAVKTLNLIAAGILWLAGESFLLLPARVKTLTGTLSIFAVLSLGVLFVFAALASGMASFLPARKMQARLLHGLCLVLLLLISGLYFVGGFFAEAALALSVAAAAAIGLANPRGGTPSEQRITTGAISMANAAVGVLLLVQPLGAVHAAARPYGLLLAGAFLLSALAGALTFALPQAPMNRLLSKLLAFPWITWILIFSFSFSLPAILIPSLVVLLLLFADSVPWNQFLLPEGDLLGRRLIFLGSVILLGAIGLLAMLLDLLERALTEAGLAADTLFVREIGFVSFTLMSIVVAYGIAMIAMTVHGLMTPDGEDTTAAPVDAKRYSWAGRVSRYLQPFSLTRDGLHARLDAQTDQINALSRQLDQEKHRASQLTLLSELNQQLEAQLDQPVAAQLAINTLQKAIDSSFICLYLHEPERREYVALATAGPALYHAMPGYRQGIMKGVLGRVTRTRKTQIVNDTRLDPDYLWVENEHNVSRSTIAVPLISTGHIKGIIEIESDRVNAFTSADVELAETMAKELVRAWERSSYHTRLMELIQAGISLSTMVEPEATIQEIATIARQTLEARFTYVSLLFDREEHLAQRAHSGQAPRLLASLGQDASRNPLLKASMNAMQPFRVRDLRKYTAKARLDLDHNGLRSMLVVPIRLHRLNIGSILAFGRQGEVFFTESDESLASLLASQAAAAIESVWLQQELRTTLRTTRLLYELSYHIIQSEGLREAAQHIAGMAHRLAVASLAGIVLFSPEGKIEAEIEVDAKGAHSGEGHPLEMINKVMRTGRVIYQSLDRGTARVCLPIQTPMRKYGVLWLNVAEKPGYTSGSPADLQTLTNQAALALERSILLVESQRQAKELETAYEELELSYDRTLAGLISALDARDSETEGHSTRVSRLAMQLGVAMGLDTQQLKALERGSLLHDIGKIGISDTILNKRGPLDEAEWLQMRRHPDIGAHIIGGIPFLEETLPVIRFHQERWDGSGYPLGLRGEEIPRLARIFAVVDAFDALTSDRPYRQKITTEAALEYIHEQAGILFDAEIVTAFDRLISEGHPDLLVSE